MGQKITSQYSRPDYLRALKIKLHCSTEGRHRCGATGHLSRQLHGYWGMRGMVHVAKHSRKSKPKPNKPTQRVQSPQGLCRAVLGCTAEQGNPHKPNHLQTNTAPLNTAKVWKSQLSLSAFPSLLSQWADGAQASCQAGPLWGQTWGHWALPTLRWGRQGRWAQGQLTSVGGIGAGTGSGASPQGN